MLLSAAAVFVCVCVLGLSQLEVAESGAAFYHPISCFHLCCTDYVQQAFIGIKNNG